MNLSKIISSASWRNDTTSFGMLPSQKSFNTWQKVSKGIDGPRFLLGLPLHHLIRRSAAADWILRRTRDCCVLLDLCPEALFGRDDSYSSGGPFLLHMRFYQDLLKHLCETHEDIVAATLYYTRRFWKAPRFPFHELLFQDRTAASKNVKRLADFL